MKVPWTARRSNQSILKEISPGCSLEGLIDATAEIPILWPPHAELTHWKRLILGGIEGRRRRGQQRMRWLDGIADLMEVSLGELWEFLMACCDSWGPKESDMTEQLN